MTNTESIGLICYVMLAIFGIVMSLSSIWKHGLKGSEISGNARVMSDKVHYSQITHQAIIAQTNEYRISTREIPNAS